MAKQTVAAIFTKVRAGLQPAFDELPLIIGNAGVNYTLDAFEKEGFEGKPWAKHKDKKATNRVLDKTSRLIRSVAVISHTQNSVIWGSRGVPYAQVHNDGLTINRAARSETFVRPRYERGKKAKYFGGMGAFRKMNKEDMESPPTKGQSYKAYNFTMPARPFIKNTVALRKHLVAIAKEEIIQAIKAIKSIS